MQGYCCTKPCRTLRVMTDEVETGSAAKKYIRNKTQLGLKMTVGDVLNGSWRENRVAPNP